MFELHINVPNMQPFEIAMSGFAENMKDFRPIWPGVVDRGIRPILTAQFGTEGAAGMRGKWADLTPAYAKRKLAMWGPKPILVASNRMRDSLLFNTGDTILDMSANALVFGTAVKSKAGFPYAVAHQTGFRTRLGMGQGGALRIGKKKARMKSQKGKIGFVPARPIFDFSTEDRANLRTVVTREIVAYVTRLGFAIGRRAGLQYSRPEATQVGAEALAGGSLAGAV